jgi:hypothetical protein
MLRNTEVYEKKEKLFNIIDEIDSNGNFDYDNFKTLLKKSSIFEITLSDNDYQSMLSHIKSKCGQLVCESILADIDILIEISMNDIYLANFYDKMVKFSKKTKFTERTQTVNRITKDFIASHAIALSAVTKNGLNSYREWLKTNADVFKKLITKGVYDARYPNPDNIKVSKKIKNLLNTVFTASIVNSINAYNWDTVYQQFGIHLDRIEDQIICYLGHKKAFVISIMSDSNNLSEMKNDIINLLKTYKKSDQIIQPRVNTTTKEESSLDENEVDDLYRKIIQINDEVIREKCVNEFEKYYPKISLRAIITSHAARLMLADHPCQILEDAIFEPKSWDDLNLSLKFLQCKSEMQFNLKLIIINYIKKQKNIKKVTENLSIIDRRLVEYLISCLFYSSKKHLDEGILFKINTTFNTDSNAAINLICKHYQSNKAEQKDFVMKLGEIYKKTKLHQILCLRAGTNQHTSLAKWIEKKESYSIDLTASESLQLYWKYLLKYHHANTDTTPDKQLEYLVKSAQYLTKSAASSSKSARDKMISSQERILLYDFNNSVINEIIATLERIPSESILSDISKKNLFLIGCQPPTNKIYNNLQQRFDEIFKTIGYKTKLEQAKYLKLSILPTPQDIARHCLSVLVTELTGKYPLHNQGHISYYFRLLPIKKFISIIDSIFVKSSEKKSLLDDLVKSYKQLIEKEFIINNSTLLDGEYIINLTVDQLHNTEGKYLSFFDTKSHEEICRISVKSNNININGFGTDIQLNIEGILNANNIIIENENSNIDLNANISSKNLYLAGKVNKLSFNGKLKVSNGIQIEFSNQIDLSSTTKIDSATIIFKANELRMMKGASVTAENKLAIFLDNSLTMFDNTGLHSKNDALIIAGSLKYIKGQIKADGTLYIESKNEIYLLGESKVKSQHKLYLKASSIVTRNKTAIACLNDAKIETSESISIHDDCIWIAENAEITSKNIDNYSPHVQFTSAIFSIKNRLINHRSAKIRTVCLLKLTGESVWNGGSIEYGKQLHVTLNRVLINGLTKFDEISDLSTYTVRNSLVRPTISGENAVIVAGLYFNSIALLTTHQLSLSCIAEITLGITTSTNKNKGRLISLDLGIDLPNVTALTTSAIKFIDACVTGDFDRLFEMAADRNTFLKVSNFTRWMVRNFTTAGRPVDLVWSVLSLIVSIPDFFDQASSLYNQGDKIQTHQIVSLMTSVTNLAIQASFVESQVQMIGNSFDSFETKFEQFNPTVALDVLSLALPFSTTGSIFSFDSGINIAANSIDRSALLFSRYSAQIGMSRTNIFLYADISDQATFQNNQAYIGDTLKNSGYSKTNQFYTNVRVETELGEITSNTVNLEAEQLNTDRGSRIHTDNIVVSAHSATLDGIIESNVAEFKVENLNLSGSIRTQHLEAISEDEIYLSGTIDIGNNKDASLRLTGNKIESTERMVISASSATTQIETMQDLHLRGIVSANILSIHASGTLEEEAKIELSSANNSSYMLATVEEYKSVNGSIHGENSAVYIVSNNNINTRTDISAKQIYMNAEGDLNQSGSLTSSNSTTLISGGNLTSSNQINTGELYEDAAGDIVESSIVIATSINTHARGNMQISGDEVAEEIHHFADGNITTNTSLTSSNSLADHEPSLSLVANNLILTENSSLNVANGSLYLQSNNDSILAGSINALKLQSTAGRNQDAFGNTVVNEAEFEAKDSLNIHGIVAFQNTESDSAIIEADGDSVNFNITNPLHGKGTVIVQARTGSIANIDVDNLSISLEHIPDVEDLILGVGRYQNIHAHNNIFIKINDYFAPTRDWQLSYGVSITARAILLLHNIWSSGSLNFVSTEGDIYVGTFNVLCDQYLEFNAHNNFIGERAILYARELGITAGLDAINDAGVWSAYDFLRVVVGGNIQNNCFQHDEQGEYDVLRAYEPASILGGSGANHDGVGLYLQAGGIFYNNASQVISSGSNIINADGGIISISEFHRFISYYRNYHNWLGRRSITIDYSYQVQSAVIISGNGSNTLISKFGGIYSLSTDFVSGNENNFSAQGNIELRGAILNNEEYKDRGNFYGIVDVKTDQNDEMAVPTVVVNPNNTNIISLGDVILDNTYLQSRGLLTIKGVNIYISAPILNHSYSIQSQGFTFNIPALSMFNSQPIIQDIQALRNANGSAEIGASIWNSLLDTVNLANSVLAGIKNGSVLQGAFPASYLISVQVGYSLTKTVYKNQTVAGNVGIFAGNLAIEGSNSVSMTNAVPVYITDDASIHTRIFNQIGAQLNSSMTSNTVSAAVGIDLTLHPTFSASESGINNRNTNYANQQLSVGGRLEVVADDWNITNANARSNTLDARISNNLTIRSVLSTANSQSQSISGSTNGNIGFQFSNSDSAVVNDKSGIEVESSADIAVLGTTHLIGSEIISNGSLKLVTNNIIAESVKEHKDGTTVGLSGNLHDIDHVMSKPEFQRGLTTVSTQLGGQTYRGEQQATIYSKNGTDLRSGVISGYLNTDNPSGHVISRNSQFDMTLKIPTNTAIIQELKDNWHGAEEKLFPSTVSGTIPTNSQVSNSSNNPAHKTHPNQEIEPMNGGSQKDHLSTISESDETLDEDNHHFSSQHQNDSSTEASINSSKDTDNVNNAISNSISISILGQASTSNSATQDTSWAANKSGSYAKSVFTSSATFFTPKQQATRQDKTTNDRKYESYDEVDLPIPDLTPHRRYNNVYERYLPKVADYSDITRFNDPSNTSLAIRDFSDYVESRIIYDVGYSNNYYLNNSYQTPYTSLTDERLLQNWTNIGLNGSLPAYTARNLNAAEQPKIIFLNDFDKPGTSDALLGFYTHNIIENSNLNNLHNSAIDLHKFTVSKNSSEFIDTIADSRIISTINLAGDWLADTTPIKLINAINPILLGAESLNYAYQEFNNGYILNGIAYVSLAGLSAVPLEGIASKELSINGQYITQRYGLFSRSGSVEGTMSAIRNTDTINSKLNSFSHKVLIDIDAGIYYQVRRLGQNSPGEFFTTVKPINSMDAEEMLNVKAWGNNAEQVMIISIKEGLVAWKGGVKGGCGLQVYIPKESQVDFINVLSIEPLFVPELKWLTRP